MARPPLALGHHGSIKVGREDGQWVARCRFRDLDGLTRRVARWGTSKADAQAALQDELRKSTGQRTEVLKPNSRFREAADVWMGKIRERRADSTADTYTSCLKNQVLSQLGELRLSECDTAHLDALFSRLEQARKVVEQPDGSMVEKPQYAACECRELCHGPLSSAFMAGRPHRHRPKPVQHDRRLWPSDSST
jgi:hypothetical protein